MHPASEHMFFRRRVNWGKPNSMPNWQYRLLTAENVDHSNDFPAVVSGLTWKHDNEEHLPTKSSAVLQLPGSVLLPYVQYFDRILNLF